MIRYSILCILLSSLILLGCQKDEILKPRIEDGYDISTVDGVLIATGNAELIGLTDYTKQDGPQIFKVKGSYIGEPGDLDNIDFGSTDVNNFCHSSDNICYVLVADSQGIEGSYGTLIFATPDKPTVINITDKEVLDALLNGLE